MAAVPSTDPLSTIMISTGSIGPIAFATELSISARNFARFSVGMTIEISVIAGKSETLVEPRSRAMPRWRRDGARQEAEHVIMEVTQLISTKPVADALANCLCLIR